MRVSIPTGFELRLDPEALEDFLINLGVAQARHDRAPDPLLSEMGLSMFVQSVARLEESSEALWEYLLANVRTEAPIPERMRESLILAVLCRFFQFDAIVRRPVMRREGERARWTVDVALRDRSGLVLAQSVGESPWFDPESLEQSAAAFQGAALHGFRDAARQRFPFGAPYDAEEAEPSGATGSATREPT
jgi:hypothetical protein